jgi:SAM-dependent methyltransferase
MVDSSFYDEDYYQRGIETGKSCYQLYRWLPELTMPMAMRIIDYLHIRPEHTVLDYGCALGYMVKAFRLLHRQAWGFDISSYAIEHVDNEVKDYCFLINRPVEIPENFDFCIAKDVLEHIEYKCIGNVLKNIDAKMMFAIVPLGKNGKYESPCNNMDKSHIICEDVDWWLNTFLENGWELINFAFRINGIKESHYKSHPRGHGFLWTRKK